jgi:hypothetical protein
VVVALAHPLGADSPVDLPLVMLSGLMEHGQHHDGAIWSAPIRYPDRHLGKPDPQLPDLAFQVIGQRPAKSRALLRQQPGDLVDSHPQDMDYQSNEQRLEWQRKGATLSDKTARQEFGLTQDEIYDAIDAGTLQYRQAHMHGNPWLRLLRRKVGALACRRHLRFRKWGE